MGAMVEARDLVGLASDPAFAVDAEGRIVAWNPGASTLLGYTPRQAIGRMCYEVVQAVLPRGEPLCTPHCEGSLCFGHRQPFAVDTCRARCRDGGWITVGISTLVVPSHRKVAANGAAAAVVFLRVNGQVRPETAAGPLRIFTFGRFCLAADGRGIAIDNWRRKQALTLLKFLVAHLGKAVHGERLVECLWPEADERRGRDRLKVTIYFLRKQLRSAGLSADVVTTVGPAYVLRGDAVWVDSEAFESLVGQGRTCQRQARCEDAIRCFEGAERLYRGDYMEEELYADWCAEERERLREVYLDVLGRLAESYTERGDYTRAEEVSRKALAHEPCRESFHRSIMQYFVRLGHLDRAILQYERCRRVLMEELGVQPTPETERLYQVILQSANGSGRAPPRR